MFFFTPLRGFYFTFPSLYFFTIGHSGVFSLTRWSSQIHTGFHVSHATRDFPKLRSAENFDYWTFTIYGAGFSCFVSFFRFFLQNRLLVHIEHFELHTKDSHDPTCAKHRGLGCSRFARRYSGNRFCFLFLRLLRCFSSPGFLFLFYEFKKEFKKEVALFGNLRIYVCYQLPEAYRRYLRPSSSLSA